MFYVQYNTVQYCYCACCIRCAGWSPDFPAVMSPNSKVVKGRPEDVCALDQFVFATKLYCTVTDAISDSLNSSGECIKNLSFAWDKSQDIFFGGEGNRNSKTGLSSQTGPGHGMAWHMHDIDHHGMGIEGHHTDRDTSHQHRTDWVPYIPFPLIKLIGYVAVQWDGRLQVKG